MHAPAAARSSHGGPSTSVVAGRLVLEDRVAPGRIVISGDLITAVEPDASAADGNYVCPGFIDLHVHGWGGHDALAGAAGLDGMARALLGRGVTSFLPTADTAAIGTLAAFAADVRRWSASVRDDRAEPLGINLEGPFLSLARKGAQDATSMRLPAEVDRGVLAPLLDRLAIITIAPELPGAPDLIRWFAGAGVTVSLGHSDASAAEAEQGIRAGARSTTHLFNAMSGLDHHAPGLAATALADDSVYVELIADGLHVDPLLWPIVFRTKPSGRVVLVSDAVALAGGSDGRATLGGQDVEVRDGRCTLVADGRLAGSVIALDTAVRNLVAHDVPIPVAVRAATANPVDLLGIVGRGRIVPGQLADLVELDGDLQVRRVMKRGRWHSTDGP